MEESFWYSPAGNDRYVTEASNPTTLIFEPTKSNVAPIPRSPSEYSHLMDDTALKQKEKRRKEIVFVVEKGESLMDCHFCILLLGRDLFFLFYSKRK